VVLQGAESEAYRLDANSVAPIHVLLAITHVPACVAAVLLRRLGVDTQTARQEFELDALGAAGSGSQASNSRTSAELAALLERAGHCADSRNTPWIGTEHLLLAALEHSNPSASLLARLGVDLPACTAELERYLVDGLAP